MTDPVEPIVAATFPGQCEHTVKVGGWELRCSFSKGDGHESSHRAVVMSNGEPEHVVNIKWNHTNPSMGSPDLLRLNRSVHRRYRMIRNEANERMRGD